LVTDPPETPVTPDPCFKVKYNIIPVVPHKAVAEVSKIGNL